MTTQTMFAHELMVYVCTAATVATAYQTAQLGYMLGTMRNGDVVTVLHGLYGMLVYEGDHTHALDNSDRGCYIIIKVRGGVYRLETVR